MAADSFAIEASEAFVDENYEAAVQLYSKAIEASPKNVNLYCARSAAHLKLDNFVEATADATRAAELDPQSGKAFFRKGEAAFNLEEYEAARDAFRAAQTLEFNTAKCRTWIRKCDAELADEEGDVEEIHPLPSKGYAVLRDAAPTAPPPKPNNGTSTNGLSSVAPSKESSTAPGTSAPLAPCATPEPQAKYRHQFFQTQAWVEVAVLAKGLSKDRVDIRIQPRHLTILISSSFGEQEYKLSIELFGEVDPAASKWELLSTKVEVRLRKAAPVAWGGLEASASSAAAPAIANDAVNPASHPPAYPSSFNRRVVDWDKLEADLKKEEKEEKLDGDAGLQKLFRDIYSSGDEDTRRAMNKSFQESKGTVLSTNWKDIGSKKVTAAPPDDMEKEKF